MLSHPTRRAARLSAAALGGVLAAAFALPVAAQAQNPIPTENGMLAFTEKAGSSYQSYVIWPDGTHKAEPDPENVFDRGIVGGWNRQGTNLMVLDMYMGDQLNHLYLSGSEGSYNGLSFMDDDMDAIGDLGNGDYSPDKDIRVWGSPKGLRMQPGPSPVEFRTHTEARDPQWANNDRLVFTSPTDGVMAIDDASTSTAVRTLVGASGLEHATVSVDGTKVAYSEHDGTSWNVRIMTVDGGVPPADLEVGTDGSDETLATMSPDGKQVVFVSNRSGKPAVWIAPVDGSAAPTKVPNTERTGTATLAGLSWQPGLKPDMLPVNFSLYPAGGPVGGSLHANYGGRMEATPTYDVAYKWEKCSIRRSDKGVCYDTGQTGSSYTFTADDRGFKIKYTRTTTNAVGTGSISKTTDSYYGSTPGVSPPRPTLTAPTGTVGGTTAKVEWNAAQPGGWFECSTDYGVTWKECESGTVLTALKHGFNTFYVTEVDDWGRRGPTLYTGITTDQQKPLPPEVWDYPAWWIETMSYPFQFTTENTPGVTIECQEDDGAWQTCTSPYTMTVTTPGQHKLSVRQTDAVGLVSDVASRTWTAKQPTPPPAPPAAPTRDSGPAALVNVRTATIAFTGADPNGTGFECRVDGGAWTACTSPFTTPQLTDGQHTADVRQLNAHGSGAELTTTWKVDATAPTAPLITAKPPTTATTGTASFTFTTEAGATAECQLDNGAWVPCASPYEVTGLLNGPHKMVVRQTDAAGNVSGNRTANWSVSLPSGVVAAPTVEAPKPEATTTTAAPATTTAAPAAAPATAAPKATTPAATTAAAKPKLTADLGPAASGGTGTGGGSTTTPTITVSGSALGVGCSAPGVVLASCSVDLYASTATATGATARAAAATKVLVGTGTYRRSAGSRKASVDVTLNATGRALLRRSPAGLEVSVAITGKPVAGPALKATGAATLLPDLVTAAVGGFATDDARLTAAAERQLRTLARQVGGTAKTVRVVGHADGSTTDSAYLKRLGARRARTVAAYLRAHGVRAKATVVSRGAAQPRATNATAAGRALNRRVELRIQR